MIKFVPDEYKVYKVLGDGFYRYCVYYRFDPSTDVWYYFHIIPKTGYYGISISHDFAKFIALRESDHVKGRLNKEIKNNLVEFIFKNGIV